MVAYARFIYISWKTDKALDDQTLDELFYYTAKLQFLNKKDIDLMNSPLIDIYDPHALAYNVVNWVAL